MLDEKTHLSNLVNVLRTGGIAIFPTDTVLGIGCLPDCDDAVKRMIRIKQRTQAKAGFILLASDIRQLSKYIDANRLDEILIKQPPNSPTTYIVPSNHQFTWLGDTARNTQAVRITDNRWVRSICSETGALVSTSANISGLSGASSIQQARMQLGPQVDYYCPPQDDHSSRRPSKIFDTLLNKFIRQ